MRLLIGTAEGMFVAGQNGGSAGRSADSSASGLDGRSVRPIYRAGETLFAGADDGIYRSRDGGATWQRCGLVGRMVWDIIAGPEGPGTIYAGTQPAGVFRSDDAGDSWTEIESFLSVPGAESWCVPNNPLGARARAVLVHPSDPTKIAVGVEVGGVITTADRGATWSCTLPGNNPDIHVMVRHPERDVLYATTGYGRIDNSEPMEKRSAGLFASEDGGASWRYLWGNLQPRYTRPMCIEQRAPHALTVACAPTAFSSIKDPGGARAMLYQSTDGGETWRSLCDTAHSPSDANFLAIACDAEQAGGVLVGTETGEVWRVTPDANWSQLAEGLPSVQGILAAASE